MLKYPLRYCFRDINPSMFQIDKMFVLFPDKKSPN